MWAQSIHSSFIGNDLPMLSAVHEKGISPINAQASSTVFGDVPPAVYGYGSQAEHHQFTTIGSPDTPPALRNRVSRLSNIFVCVLSSIHKTFRNTDLTQN